jgi:hypothetical protein
MVVEVVFNSFALEHHCGCIYDYVVAKDGNGSRLMDKSCGSKKPKTFRSHTNIVKIGFTTDHNVTDKGFKLSWKAVPGPRTPVHTIMSQNYPKNYPNHYDKNYLIKVDGGWRIKITFEAFNLESEKNCAFDYLQVNQLRKLPLPPSPGGRFLS